MQIPPDPRPIVVLDTNVVLDWLVFDDPSCRLLGAAIESSLLRWIASAEMREEFDEVLERGVGAARQPDRHAIDLAWQRLVEVHPPAPIFAASSGGQRVPCCCTDPDDQKFIDLALQHRASWLLSRDRAVLALAREAGASGLSIVAPRAWQGPDSRPLE